MYLLTKNVKIMRKQLLNLLTVVSMMLMCGVGSAWAQTTTYDLSTWAEQDPTTTTTVNGLTYYGDSKSGYAAGDKLFEDGKTFTGRIKLGGASTIQSDKTLSRVFSFNVTKDCTIKVYAVHGSSSGDPRTVYMTQKLTSTKNDVSAAIASCATPAGGPGILTGKASAGTVYIWADNNVGIYAITITDDAPPTQCTTPTAKQESFSFEKHEYPVIFTAKTGETLFVSVDGGTATEMTSPATVYPKEKASAYAKADGLEDSEPIEVTALPNNFDKAKPYIAWIYTSTYTSVKDGFESDKILNGLRENYNVVLVDYADGTKPSEDLNNADVIIATEAMSGGKTMSNGLKSFVGVTPMISLKMFNYTSGRWGWGTPKNPGKEIIGLTPTSKYYKVLDGITTEADGTITFYTAENDATQNHIQTVDFTSAPEGNIIMGTAANSTAMHCTDKFFGIGLSSDDWKSYNDNAVVIIKNAVAMLIAGEPLNAEHPKSYTLNAEDTEYYGLYLDYAATIPTGVTAYTGVLSDDESTLKVTKIDGDVLPANCAVLVKATEAGEYKFEASDATADGITSVLKGVTANTNITDLAETGKVVLTLGMKDGVVGFRKPANAQIMANKAYLLVSEVNAAKGVKIAFGGETTGISEIDSTANEANEAVYDLTGRRVSADAKGLLIKNGKKFINK